MPRPKRIHYEGAVYHVTSRGNERRKIFLSDEERWLFLRILEEMVEHHGVVCHAWVLMDNHYHLLLETPEANLSFAMKHLNAIYTQKFNKKHHRSGHLFQGRFKAIVVEKDSYLKELCRYVVLNPVRAKMVKHPKDWKWSSYRGTAGQDKPEKWMETDWLLGQFGRNKKQAQLTYKKFVEEGIGKKGSPWDELDVPKYQKDVVKRNPEEVLKTIGKVYGVKADEILKSGKRGFDARDMAIYLLKKESKLSLKDIGERIGVGFSAVGNQWTRVKKRLETDAAFAQMVLKCKM